MTKATGRFERSGQSKNQVFHLIGKPMGNMG